MKILLLGGTRFFGRLVVPRLLADGHEVVLVSRRRADWGPGQGGGRQIVGEREDSKTLAAVAAHGPFDVVIDNIAYRPRQVELLLPTVVGKGASPLYVLTSSSAVYLDRFVEGPLSEDRRGDAVEPDALSPAFPSSLLPYAIGKIGCERVVAASGLPFLILRLPFVCGPGDFALRLAYFLHRLRVGGGVCVPAGAGWLQQLYCADLPGVYAEAVQRGRQWGGAVNVAPDPMRVEDLVVLLAKAIGIDAGWVRRLEDSLWQTIADAFPYVYDQIMATQRYHACFATPLTPMAAFLGPTVAWYRANPHLWRHAFCLSGRERRLYDGHV